MLELNQFRHFPVSELLYLLRYLGSVARQSDSAPHLAATINTQHEESDIQEKSSVYEGNPLD
jgi:hypothetical protein